MRADTSDTAEALAVAAGALAAAVPAICGMVKPLVARTGREPDAELVPVGPVTFMNSDSATCVTIVGRPSLFG